MHQNIMAKIKEFASEDWIVLDVIIKHSIKIFKCYIWRINSMEILSNL